MEQKDIISNAITLFGEQSQIIVAIEELSELQKELCKRLRGNYSNSEQIAEEVADVKIMLSQIVQLFEIDEEVDIFTDFKLHRLAKRIAKEYAEIWAREGKDNGCF